MFARLTKMVCAFAAFVGLAAAHPAVAEDPAKVGFVYVGPVGDHGWTYRHDIGRQAIEKELGDKVETTFVESVQEGPDAERVIRQMASSGHKLIFTTSFGFMQPTRRVLFACRRPVAGWSASRQVAASSRPVRILPMT